LTNRPANLIPDELEIEHFVKHNLIGPPTPLPLSIGMLEEELFAGDCVNQLSQGCVIPLVSKVPDNPSDVLRRHLTVVQSPQDSKLHKLLKSVQANCVALTELPTNRGLKKLRLVPSLEAALRNAGDPGGSWGRNRNLRTGRAV
jgi:hypothetical protein